MGALRYCYLLCPTAIGCFPVQISRLEPSGPRRECHNLRARGREVLESYRTKMLARLLQLRFYPDDRLPRLLVIRAGQDRDVRKVESLHSLEAECEQQIPPELVGFDTGQVSHRTLPTKPLRPSLVV